MRTWIFGPIGSLRITTLAPNVFPGGASFPGSGIAFAVHEDGRLKEEHWSSMRGAFLYAREVPPDAAHHIELADTAVTAAEAALERARKERQDTLAWLIARSKPARLEKGEKR